MQAFTLRGYPFTRITVFWMFASQRRFVLRFEWLTLWPKAVPFPQISQRLAIVSLLRARPPLPASPSDGRGNPGGVKVVGLQF